MQIKNVVQEPYEAPAISEIAPVTFTNVVGLTGEAADPGEPDPGSDL